MVSKIQGWEFPPEGARTAAASTAVMSSGAGVSCSLADPAGAAVAGFGDARSAKERARSTRTRPDDNGSPRPRRQMAAPTRDAPRLTSPASCGQVVTVWSTSAMEAAMRADNRSASRMRST